MIAKICRVFYFIMNAFLKIMILLFFFLKTHSYKYNLLLCTVKKKKKTCVNTLLCIASTDKTDGFFFCIY